MRGVKYIRKGTHSNVSSVTKLNNTKYEDKYPPEYLYVYIHICMKD